MGFLGFHSEIDALARHCDSARLKNLFDDSQMKRVEVAGSNHERIETPTYLFPTQNWRSRLQTRGFETAKTELHPGWLGSKPVRSSYYKLQN